MNINLRDLPYANIVLYKDKKWHCDNCGAELADGDTPEDEVYEDNYCCYECGYSFVKVSI